MIRTWNIEIKECNWYWETRHVCYDEIDAFHVASELVQEMREEWIRIVTPEGKII